MGPLNAPTVHVGISRPAVCLSVDIADRVVDAGSFVPGVLPHKGCGHDEASIVVAGVLEAGRAAADVTFHSPLDNLMFHPGPGNPALGPQRNGNPIAKSSDESVTLRAHVHAEWDVECADPGGAYALEYQGRPVSGGDFSTTALALLCGSLSPAAIDLRMPPVLLALARDIARDQPEAGAFALALVEGLPTLEAPPAPVEERRHVEGDGELDAQAQPSDAAVEAAGSGAVEAGGVAVETGDVAASSPALDVALVAPPPPREAPSAAPAPLPAAPAPASPSAPAAPAQKAAPHPGSSAPGPRPPAPSPARASVTVVSAAPVHAIPPAAVAAATGAAGALLLLAFALYQRIGRHSALSHPTRAALHRAATEAGMATVGTLAAAVGARRKQAEYHLRYLVRAGLLREHARPDSATLYVAPSARVQDAQEPLAARLVDALRQRPGQSASELARAAGVGYGRVDRRLKDLLREGMLESRVDAGERRYFAPA